MVEPGYKECPACAEIIREKAKLCRFCGAVLTEEPLPPIASREERELARVGGEEEEVLQPVPFHGEIGGDLGELLMLQSRRKLEDILRGAEDQYRSATVLFVDIVGYTTICERLRAEETKDILDAYYAICAHMVDFFNGFVLEFQGDGCLAVFGAPVAYERDAEGAVRAALEIRERVQALPVMHGEKLRLTVGIETGTVLSSVIRTRNPPTYKVFGAPVNLAARIRSAAAPDQILIGPATYDLVRDAFRCRRRKAQKFKNVEHAVATYEVVEALAATAITRRDFDVPLLGRDREMARLQEIWSRFLCAKPEERPAGILLEGEPGIGKTRLTLEFLKQVSGVRTVRVEGTPYGAKVSWALWRTLLLQLLGETPPEVGTGGRNWAAYARALERLGYRPADQLSLLALLGDPRAQEQLASLTPSGIKRLLHADLRALLQHAAAGQPLLVILDDLQWADGTSLEALRDLLAAPPANTFFLLAHRQEFDIALPAAARVERLLLRGLDVRSRRALFNVLADVRTLLPEMRERLVHQEAGNPYYMLELARAVIRDMPQPHSGTKEIQKLQDFVPGSLVEILQARIDSLDQRRKLVLQCAAVIGKRFTLQFMEFFDFIQEGLLARLYSLKSLQMLDDAITLQGLEFFFLHHVTREVSYRTLLDRQRRDLHLFVAQEIEKRHPENRSEHAALLAYHYVQADDERSVPYLKISGDHAALLGGTAEALENYSEAVRRLRQKNQPSAGRRQLALLLKEMGRLHRFCGEPAQAEAELAEAIEILRKLKNRPDLGRARVERGLLRVQSGDYAAAEDDFNGALSVADSTDQAILRAEALNGLGMCAWGRGALLEARLHFEQAQSLISDPAPPFLASVITNNLGLVAWREGDLRRAARLMKEALRFQRQTGDKFNMAATVMNLGILEENMGRLQPAERRYREALELAERIQFQQVITASYANLASLCLAGDLSADALQHSSHALLVAERIGDRRSAAIALENLALSHLAMSQFKEVRRHVREGRLLAEELADQERIFSLDLVDLELALAEGKTGRLASRFARAEKLLDHAGYEAERPRLLRLQAMHSWRNKETAAAEEIARRALETAQRQQNRTEEARLRKLLEQLK